MDYLSRMVIFLIKHGLQGYAAEILVDGAVQVFPQVVGQAWRAVVAVGLTAALRGIEFVFRSGNDLGNVDLVGTLGQNVTAARPAYAVHQFGPAEFAKQLFQIG